MGWDFCDNWKKKSDVVAAQLAGYNSSPTFEVVAYKSTTNGLWVVVRNRETGLKGIIFDLIEKQGGSWGVKGMDESMGPYYYDCPKKFIDMVPPVASESFMYNLEWRRQWRQAHGME